MEVYDEIRKMIVKLFAVDAPKLVNLLKDDCAMGFEVMNELINIVAIRLRDTAQLLVAERSLA